MSIGLVTRTFHTLSPQTANLSDAATTLALRCATKFTASAPFSPLGCITLPSISLISLFPLDRLAAYLVHRLDICASVSYVPHVLIVPVLLWYASFIHSFDRSLRAGCSATP